MLRLRAHFSLFLPPESRFEVPFEEVSMTTSHPPCFTLASILSMVAATFFAIVFSTLVSAQGTTANQSSSITVENIGAQVSPLFLPSVLYKTGGSEAGFVTVADVNRDGFPDLLVANTYYSDTVGVLQGKGDGTFWGAVKYASGGGYPSSIVAIDLNNDGKLDLVVLNQGRCYACAGDGLVAVLLGKGKGKFLPAVTYDSGGQGGIGPAPGGLAVADVNGDGKLDVVVMNCASRNSTGCGDGNGVVGVLLGNGDGTLKPVVTYDSGSAPGGGSLAVADVNGDKKPDILVTSGCTNDNCPQAQIGVLLNNGDGTFKKSVNYAASGWNAAQIAVADLNGDGKPDVVVGGCGTINCFDGDGVVTVLLGKGDGTFQAPVGFDSGGERVDGVAIADIDGDGKLDVVVGNTISNSVGVLLGNGDGSLRLPVVFPSGTNTDTYSVAISDVDGDGKPDVMVSNCGGTQYACGGNIQGTIGVLLSYGTLSKTTLTTSGSPSQLGQMVTFTAKVSSSAGAIPDGDVVAFYDGKNAKLASVPLLSGVATFSTSSLTAGSHNIEALYLGDPGFKRSSAVVKQVVQKP